MGAKYTTQAVSGFNASPPADDGSQTDANKVYWRTIKQKLGDPLNNWADSVDDALVAAFDYSVNQKTANYTTVAGDHMRTVEIAPTVSSAVTISLGDASTMASGYMVRVKNSSAVTCTLGRATGGDTIDGTAANVTLPAKCSLIVQVNTGATGYLILAGFWDTFDTITVSGVASFPGGINGNAGNLPAVVTDTPTHIFSADGVGLGLFIVTAAGRVQGADYACIARVYYDGANVILLDATNGADSAITVDGASVRYQQGSGGNMNVDWFYLLIGNG